MNDCKRQPQLLEQLDITEKKTALCHELAQSLNARLSGVLRPELPMPPSNGRLNQVSPQESLVPAAERVRACGQHAESALTLMQGILDRLEA